MNTNGIITVIVIVVVIVSGIFLLGRDGTEDTLNDGGSPIISTAPAYFLSVNELQAGSTVVVNTLSQPETGYVVVHRSSTDNKPGPVIGNSSLLSAGLSTNVSIQLSEEVAKGDVLFAMLHSDDGNGTYEFPGPDAPVVFDDGTVVMVRGVVGENKGKLDFDVLEKVVEENESMMEETTDSGSEKSQTEEPQPNTGTESPEPTNTPEQTGTTINVTYTDASGFIPNTITVSKGDTVTWTNNSGRPMWVASAIHPTHTVYPEKTAGDCLGSAFDACEGISIGEVYSFTFNEIGEWGYHDHLKASQRGKVIVE